MDAMRKVEIWVVDDGLVSACRTRPGLTPTGDAVNPSLEAWAPHPCGAHPRRCQAAARVLVEVRPLMG
jgi:hypothetical protein